MDPKKPTLDPKQQETLNRVMSTPTSPSAGTAPQATPINPPKTAANPDTTPPHTSQSASPFPSFSSPIPDPAATKPSTPPASTPTPQAPAETGGGIPPSSPFMTPQAAAKPTDVKSYANIPMAQAPASSVHTVIKAPTVGATPPTPQAAAFPPTTTPTTNLSPAASTAPPSTAPTNTKTPPPGKKRSPLIMILFIFLGIILMAAYAIVWSLVFGLKLPFALPF